MAASPNDIVVRSASVLEVCVYSVLVAVSVGYAVYANFRFYQLRDTFPIAERHPRLVMLGYGFGTLFSVMIVLATIAKDAVNCFAFTLSLSVLTSIIVISTLMRMTSLWIQVKFTASAVDIASVNGRSSDVGADRAWIFTAKKFWRDQKRIWVPIIVSGILITLTLAPVIRSFVKIPGSFGVNMRMRACLQVYQGDVPAALIATNAISIAFILGLYWMIRKFQDNFFIREEFSRLGRAFLVPILFLFIFNLVPSLHSFDENVFTISLLFFPVAICLTFKISMIDIIKIAEKQKEVSKASSGLEGSQLRKRREEKIRSSTQLLKSVLADPMQSLALKHFMIKEFSVENFLFLKSVDAIRDTPSDVSGALEIYNTYCTVDAPVPINIPHQNSKNLKAAFEALPNQAREISPEVMKALNAAYDEIFQLVLQDSFSRFKIVQGLRDDQSSVTSRRTSQTTELA
eukprot:TRINITY_DN20867_c0_g1_i1.p1 TRINITY_DN20867_c0_g1~~TRINITY_DN20867_c0_g1_i1.p1  ORF type:complete len:459 (+),score=110.36 TRINITY_DN20867_c0_g1_i1:124-1500(+)